MKLYKKLLKRIENGEPIYCNETFAKDLEAIANNHYEQLSIQRVVSSACKCGRMSKCGERSGLCPETGICHS
ncbi:hypothetical protein Phi39:1_gp02 [Cellulophaga phage phi39:1]|uniref:hypothetical protein n=1 Tax=Cellulophaga phage phi39:1 TaxID=1327993 RepID=UPI0003514C43|nr:hypothetical protein Phi39:1_gp02 [Cellulophaga phage phi39:1]AGO49117.1 hypothetical protein Phi39:1_gp02 [Cellulophaga phage phi39:1]